MQKYTPLSLDDQHYDLLGQIVDKIGGTKVGQVRHMIVQKALELELIKPEQVRKLEQTEVVSE